MSYENAKATILLASHCCVCGRPLADAKSVELGIGPVCRQKYMGAGTGISEEARQEANKLVYDASALYGEGATDEDIADICKIVDRLAFLGFEHLSERVAFRFIPIRLQVEDDVAEVRWDSQRRCEVETGRTGTVVNVWTPRDEDFNAGLRRLSYKRGVRDTKRGWYWQVRRADSRALLGLLSEVHAGRWAISDKGTFQIPTPDEFKAQFSASRPCPTRKGDAGPGHRADDNQPAKVRGSEAVHTFDLAAFKRRRVARNAGATA